MEENVALDSSKQKKFVKSISGIKKLLKKNVDKEPEQKVSEPDKPEPKVKKAKKPKSERGLVYLSHIPHGFYEKQMGDYFKQFGQVTNVRVIRSERTGRSKGYAFVEFRQPAVAQIVAETMNNYLMGKRLIKAVCIPPEKQRRNAKRKHWTTLYNPSNERRIQQKRAYNAVKTDQQDLKKAKKILSNLETTKKKLSELGINYDFFVPVDIPEELLEVKVEKVDDTVAAESQIKTKQKKGNKNIEEPNDDLSKANKKVKIDIQPKVEKNKKTKKSTNEVKRAETEVKIKNTVKAETVQTKNEKNKAKKVKSQQNKETVKKDVKEVKLKNTGVKPLEGFVKIQNDSDDSSVEFDSDEFEKMLENESDADSSLNDDASSQDDDAGSSDTEESVVDYPPVTIKGKSQPKAVKTVSLNNKKSKKVEQKKDSPPQKRKAVPIVAITSKKPKFEKQVKQKPKKQFKKK